MYILDTNAIIDFLDGNTNIAQKLKDAFLHDTVKIPDIAYYEILRGFRYKDPQNQIGVFEKLCRQIGFVDLNLQSLRIASDIWAALRRKGITIDDDDIFIAALSLEHNAVIVTNNTKHFAEIPDIQIENWN